MSLLERIYFFHDQLNRNRYPNARDLMREFEISLPTARRDIAYLRDRLLAPLEFNSSKNGFYYSDNSFSLPFENSPRIIFLLGMLNKLAEETGLSELPEIRQLEKRLSSMVSGDSDHLTDKIHCEWIEVEYPNPKVFDTIIESIIKKRQLSINYQSLKKELTSRTVEPHKLINYQGRWYLLAWCTLRKESRIFHLARILDARLENIACLTQFQDPEELQGSFGIFKGRPRYHAEIEFTGEAAELVRKQHWHDSQQVMQTEGGIVMRLPVHDDREIMMKVLQYGAQARVVGPPELASKIASEAGMLLGHYKK